MLKKAPYKLHCAQRHRSHPPAFGFSIFEGHFAVFNFDNPVIRDSHFEHIAGQVSDALFGAAGSLHIDVPPLFPDFGRNFRHYPGIFHQIPESGSIYL